MEQALQGRVRFGSFELDPRAGELHQNGQSTILQEQQLKLLLMLIEREGEIATREEIKKKLWPNDTIVEFDHGINNTIKNLRRLLDDSADNPKYIATIARRGYRLMVPVEWVSGAEDSSSDADSGAGSGSDSEVLSTARLKGGRLTGKVVSHYRVLEVIGGGGMGLVYKAEDLKLGRAVALKFLPEEVGDDPKARERFDREARSVSALSHPNVCPIYEFAEHEGQPFIVMELLQGRTLRDHLGGGRFRLTEPEGLEIAIQIASGLEAAHEKGIIHRDIKPANIFITEKNVAKILDFGVAKIIQLSESVENPHPANGRPNGAPGVDLGLAGVPRLAAQLQARSLGMTDQEVATDGAPEAVPLQIPKETVLTRTGMKLGTAGYMSPEQVRCEPLDARTDIFSFGLVLYEMATGERAFSGETEAILHDAIQHREPKPVRELAPEIPSTLQGIIERCLEKGREKRFQSAAEIRACLEQQSRSSGKMEAKRLTGRFVVAAALVIVITLTVVVVLYHRAHPRFQLTDKDTIVVADFENKTGDPVFDGGLRDGGLSWALWISLEQTPFLNLLGDDKVSRMLAQSGHSAVWGSPLTLENAKQVCSATHSAVVVGGSIADAGNHYQIALKATRCDTNSIVSDVNLVANDRQSIVRELGRAAVTLRKDLSEPTWTIREFNQPLETASSSSPEALKAVMEARKRDSTIDNLAAVEYAERAVELDPSFGFGWSMLATIYANTGRGDPRVAIEKAYALRDRLTRRMQLELEGHYFFFGTEEWDKAVNTYRGLTEKYPNSPWAHNNLSVALRNIASYEQSATEARESIRLNPDVYHPYHNLIYAELGLEHYAEAETVFKDLGLHHLDSELLQEERFWLSFLERDTAAMQSQLKEEAQRSKSPYAWLARLASAEAYFGHFRRARSSLNLAIAAARNAGQPDGVAAWELGQALDEVEVGNGRLEAQWAERSQRQKPDDSLFLLPSLPARLGEIQSAKITADRFNAKYPKATTWRNLGLPCYRAAVALSQDKSADAVESLREALPHEMNQDIALYSAYLRGIALLESHDGGKAAAEFQKVVDHPGVLLIHVWGALAHLQLARAQVMTGDKEAARESYQDFLTLWKDADPDIPIYRQAKAEYKMLK